MSDKNRIKAEISIGVRSYAKLEKVQEKKILRVQMKSLLK